MTVMFDSISMPTPDGTRLHVRRHTRSNSELTCVMIHGFGEGGYVWNDTCDVLGQQYSLVVVDLRGHGQSQRSASGVYDLSTHVADVAQLVSSLVTRRIVLIGHSLGGLVTIHIAARVHGIAAAVLVDTAPDTSAPGSHRAAENLRRNLRVYAAVEDYAHQLLQDQPLLSMTSALALAQGALKPCEGGHELRIDPALLASLLEDGPREMAQLDQLLTQIDCPTLLMRGVGSAVVTAAAARRAARKLSRGRLVTVPAAGHAVMTENATDFIACVVEFLDGLSAVPHVERAPAVVGR